MRVYILSTYPAVRAGLAALLRDQPGVLISGMDTPAAIRRAADDTAAAPAADAPDIVLADLDGAPEAEAIEAWLTALRPLTGVVVLSAPTQNTPRGPGRAESIDDVAQVARAAEAHGLSFGMIPREATPEDIMAALTAVHGGLIALDRRLAGGALARGERTPPPIAASLNAIDDTLTSRELDVLQLLAQGLPNKTIAARLHISEHTAKFHVSAIMTKLGAASRTEAVTLAARRGLLIL